MAIPENGYALNKTGPQTDEILARAAVGGEIDMAIAAKAPLNSPAFTGTPKAPIPADGADNDQVATVKTVSDAVSAVDQVAIVNYIQNPNATLWNAISDAYTAGKEVILKRSTTSGGVTNNYFYTLDNRYNNNASSPYYERFSFVGTENNKLLKRYTLECNHLNSTYSWDISTTQLQEKLTFDDAPTEGSSNPVKSGGVYTAIATAKSDLQDEIDDAKEQAQADAYKVYPTDTASGAIASFPDGADNVPVKSLIAQITPLQAGSGDPSPDNIRPISGWTGAKITDTGKNLCNPSARIESANIEANGEIVASIYNLFIAPVKSGETYTITTNDVTAIVFAYFSAYPSMGSVSYDGERTVDSGSLTTKTITAPIDGYIVFRANSTFITPQFEVGSTATTYEAYNGSQIDVSWQDEAGTVYGGALTYLGSGKYSLQPTHLITDLGEANYWTASGSEGLFLTYSMTDWIKYPPDVNTVIDGLCESYAIGSYSAHGDMSLYSTWQTAGTKYVAILDSRHAGEDGPTFRDSIRGIKAVFALATLPEPIILDAEDVKTLLGDNNIFCDTGDVDVTYRADTALYIAKKLAEA